MTSGRSRRLAAVVSLLALLVCWNAAGQGTKPYGCPMHPDRRSATPGICPVCGMDLVLMDAPGVPPYRVTVESTPRVVEPGQPFRLRLSIAHPTTGERVTDLTIVHEMPFHLFVVSDDLAYYDHIHPTLDADGAFVVETEFPRSGEYHLFCDFLPAGGAPQVIHKRMATAGFTPDRAKPPLSLTADAVLTKVVDGIRFELTLDPPRIAAGVGSVLTFHLVDDRTGVPVTDLEPYLGAWGHTLILSDDAERYLHCHPTQMIAPDADRSRLSGGPAVSFNATLRRPGIHRLWSQFKRAGKVTTVSFTIDVASLAQVAVWNGTAWSELAGGPSQGPNGSVRALATRGEELFAGGDGAAARWDGRRWSALGRGLDGVVHVIAVSGTDLYFGGEFTTAGERAASSVARWDGRTWSPLGSGLSGGGDVAHPAAAHAIVVRGRDVYIGGRFTTAGGVPANGIARWDGARFTPLGSGVGSGEGDGIVRAMAFFRGELYAGGEFLTAGGVTVRNIARWDGRSWSAVGGGVTGGLESVSALAVAGDRLLVGGDFTTAGEVAANRIAAWDGTRWQPLGVEPKESVRAIAVRGSDVYIAGPNGIVSCGGTECSTLGGGLGSGNVLAPVLAIAPAGRTLYVGGGPFIVR